MNTHNGEGWTTHTGRRWKGALELGQIIIIGKFRLKLKKVGKTTRPFKYDLNKIPYDSTVEVRNNKD